jgi:hypothetical protein
MNMIPFTFINFDNYTNIKYDNLKIINIYIVLDIKNNELILVINDEIIFCVNSDQFNLHIFNCFSNLNNFIKERIFMQTYKNDINNFINILKYNYIDILSNTINIKYFIKSKYSNTSIRFDTDSITFIIETNTDIIEYKCNVSIPFINNNKILEFNNICILNLFYYYIKNDDFSTLSTDINNL